MNDDELNCPSRVEKQQKERCREDGKAETAYRIEQSRDNGRRGQHDEHAAGDAEHPARRAGAERHAEQPRSKAGIHARHLRFASRPLGVG